MQQLHRTIADARNALHQPGPAYHLVEAIQPLSQATSSNEVQQQAVYGLVPLLPHSASLLVRRVTSDDLVL